MNLFGSNLRGNGPQPWKITSQRTGEGKNNDHGGHVFFSCLRAFTAFFMSGISNEKGKGKKPQLHRAVWLWTRRRPSLGLSICYETARGWTGRPRAPGLETDPLSCLLPTGLTTTQLM